METVSSKKDPTFLKEQIQSANFLKLPKNAYGGLSIFSLVMNISLFYFGNEGIIEARYAFSILAPFFTFIFFLCLTLYLGYEEYNENSGIGRIIGFLLISGLTITMISLILNTRGQYAFIFTYASIDPNSSASIEFLIGVIMAPIIEETMKAIPIFVLMKGFYQAWGGESKRILGSAKMTALAGIIVAGIFTTLETYFYIVSGIDTVILQIDDAWNYVYTQIIIRSTSPLHYTTVAIVSLSVFLSLYNTRNRTLSFLDTSPVIFGYGVALFLHGLWNYTAIQITSESTLLFDFYPLNLFILGMISLVLLLGIVFYSTKIPNVPCPYCSLIHVPPFDEEFHYSSTSFINMPSFLKRFRWQRARKKLISQHFKFNFSKIFACDNCSYPIPVYSVKCWNCKYTLDPPYSNVFNFRKDTIDNFSIGLTFILGLTYSVTTFIVLVRYAEVFAQDDGGILILFLSIMGLSYIWGSYWSLNPKTKPLGIIISRLLTGAFFIQIIFLMQTIGVLVASVSGVLIVTAFNVAMLFPVFSLILGYEPVIDGGVVHV